MNFHNALLAASILFAALPAAAASNTDSIPSSGKEFPEETARRRLVDNTKVVFINSDDLQRPSIDTVRSLITTFYVNQFRHFQDPRAPYFMFMSKDANLAMGIGGMVRMRGWFDWNGNVPANGFAPIAIDMSKDPTQMKRFRATPAGSGLFFTIMGRNTKLGDFMGYIEANFNGYNHLGFQLKKAYFTLNDWTVGYATSTFSDPAAQPPVIDGAGANGKVDKTNVLVRYLHQFKKRKGWSIAASLEFPQSGITDQAGETKACADWLPDVAAFGQYEWDGGLSHVRLSAMLRTLTYRDLLTAKNRNKLGWGVQLSGMVKVLRPLTLYGTVSYGTGNSSYLNDIAGSSLDLVPEPGRPGYLYAPSAFSAMVGAKYMFTQNIYASCTLSELMYYSKKAGRNPDDYRYGLYGALSLFWDITPRIQVGAEYLAIKRVNNSGATGNGNRIDALFMFSF